MKKVLVFGITENPGGVESVIMNYYRNINKEKIQFDFLCNTEIVAYEDEILQLGGNIYRITARSKNRKQYKKDLKTFFEAHKGEYSSIWVNVCSLANIDYLKYAKKYGIEKRIIHAHNSQNMDSFIRGILHRINKLIISKYATDYWSCSKESSCFFYNRRLMKSSDYRIINNAIDTEKYKYDENTRNEYRRNLNIDDKIAFVSIGRLHFQKNQEFVIKIFKKINEKNPNTVLYLIGDGPDKTKIKRLIGELELDNSVFLLGIRDDVPELLQSFDVLLFPSIFEGLPLVLIEAQASDILIFASENIESDEVLMNKEKIRFMSLEKSAEEWANEIIREFQSNSNRSDSTESIKQHGFDIKTETKKFERIII